MTVNSSEHRIAVLLATLGMDVTDPTFDSFPPEPRNRVKKLIVEYQSEPKDDREVDAILGEFLRMLRFAKQATSESDTPQLKLYSPGDDHVTEKSEPKPEFKPTDDPFVDLKRLEPYQVMGALRDEQPRTIALVLKSLPPNKAGEALQMFEPRLQNEVFLLLKNPPTAPRPLLAKIVRATVDKGCVLDEDSMNDPEEETYRELAEVLRAMSQSERARILEGLNEADPESIDRLRKMLFMFDDVLRLTDRCTQKLLTNVDSATLSTALKNAPEEYMNKFANNLSKRARATLLEEIEFMANVKEEEEEAAKSEICSVMATLDGQGDLEFDA